MPIYKFILNGQQVETETRSDSLLLDTIRENFGLTGTKEGCGKGECGACTVIVDGKAVNSCLVLTSQIENCRVQTIEGLQAAGQLDPLQEAFVKAGAVQCGYCTPGMIMSAKALLDKRPSPSTQEIKESMAGNLCRCTGYTKIIQAVELAAATYKRD